MYRCNVILPTISAVLVMAAMLNNNDSMNYDRRYYAPPVHSARYTSYIETLRLAVGYWTLGYQQLRCLFNHI